MKPGTYINVHLIEPVERLWGRLIKLDQAGVVIRGVDVKQVETFKFQFNREDKLVFPQTIFFPMRRVQKVDLDEALDTLPSVIETIEEITGLSRNDIIKLED